MTGGLPDANQPELGKRRWNLASFSGEVEFHLRTVTDEPMMTYCKV